MAARLTEEERKTIVAHGEKKDWSVPRIAVATGRGTSTVSRVLIAATGSARRDRRTTAEQRADIVKRYAKQPIRAIAAETGWSYGTVYNVLVTARVKLRQHGGHYSKRH